jgi:hypothetical protein
MCFRHLRSEQNIKEDKSTFHNDDVIASQQMYADKNIAYKSAYLGTYFRERATSISNILLIVQTMYINYVTHPFLPRVIVTSNLFVFLPAIDDDRRIRLRILIPVCKGNRGNKKARKTLNRFRAVNIAQ